MKVTIECDAKTALRLVQLLVELDNAKGEESSSVAPDEDIYEWSRQFISDLEQLGLPIRIFNAICRAARIRETEYKKDKSGQWKNIPCTPRVASYSAFVDDQNNLVSLDRWLSLLHSEPDYSGPTGVRGKSRIILIKNAGDVTYELLLKAAANRDT